MKDAGVPDTIETLDFTMDAGLGARATIGLVVLQSDQTIEFEFARLVRGEGVAVYHARIPNAMEVTPDTLRQMERDLPKTVALLPEAYGFDAIGYGCTSGATMIGEERVDTVIRRYHPSAKTSNPIRRVKGLANKRIWDLIVIIGKLPDKRHRGYRKLAFYALSRNVEAD